MRGIVYVACTNVGRAIIQSHIKNHPNIPILALINLSFESAINKANFDSMHDLCIENNIDLILCQNINEDYVLQKLISLAPDLIIQSGWSQKFSNRLLEIPRFGCIGEHPSPLPVGRGAACVNWAIIQGQKKWGDSFFRMTSSYDVGDILSIDNFEILDSDTCKTIYDKVALSAYKVIDKYLHSWAIGSFQPVTVDESLATYYKKRTPKDGTFTFKKDARSIIRTVNALTKPYPGARFIYKNIEIIVWKASFMAGDDSKLKAGTITKLKNSNLAVVCPDGNYVILEELSSKLIPPSPPTIFFELFLENSKIDYKKICFV